MAEEVNETIEEDVIEAWEVVQGIKVDVMVAWEVDGPNSRCSNNVVIVVLEEVVGKLELFYLIFI